MKPKDPTIFGFTKRELEQYAKGIKQITGKILTPKHKEQSFDDWLKELAERSAQKDVQEASEYLARQMVERANYHNLKTWREAAAKHMRSRELHLLLEKEMQGATGLRVRQLISENAHYISSLPLVAATKFVEEVGEAQRRGARPAAMAKLLKARFPQLLKSRVHLISRTETAKASTALTQARCEELSIEFYQWMTSEDVRVRLSHKKMNDVIVPWNDAPDPDLLAGVKSTLGHGHAGQFPNCRCSQRVILNADDIKFPARVYYGSAVHNMTKTQFKQQFAAL